MAVVPTAVDPAKSFGEKFFCGHELEHVLKIHMDTYVGIESNKNSFLNAEHDMIRFSVIIFFFKITVYQSFSGF